MKNRKTVEAVGGNGISENICADHAWPIIAENPREMSFRDLHKQMSKQVFDGTNTLKETYRNYHGRDLRKHLAHLVEQAGISIREEVEREKREMRAKDIKE